MPKSLRVRIEEALNVSGAFDNCFFHTYTIYLLANKLPLPEDLFTFKSILGAESPASKLQARFPNQDSLSLFAEFAQRHHPDEAPLSPDFIVEKTLVLGFLMREWFATQMAQSVAVANRIQEDALTKFKNYRTSRWDEIDTDLLLSGPEGVLYTANKAFLEYYMTHHPQNGTLTEEEARFKKYFTDAAEDEDKALEAYWKAEGYQNYCRLIANPSTKLAYNDVMSVIEMLNQPLAIYNIDQSIIYSNKGREDLPKMEVKFHAMAGHYYLLKTDETAPLLREYAQSMEQYAIDREVVLRVIGDKNLAAEEQSSLLVGAICPNGHLNKPSFNLLLDKVDLLHEFVREHQQSELLKARQEEQLRKQQEEEQSAKKLEEERVAHQHQKPSTTTPSAQAHAVPNPFKLEFDNKLELLANKMTQFHGKPKLERAYNAAKNLYTALKEEGDIYFGAKPSQSTYQTFKENCEGHITIARDELDNHRGWSKIILNVLAIVFTAGIGYLFAAGINMAVNKGKFTLFSTDSSLVIDNIEDSISKSNPTP